MMIYNISKTKDSFKKVGEVVALRYENFGDITATKSKIGKKVNAHILQFILGFVAV